MLPWPTLLLTATLGGCRVVDAPEALEALVVFAFVSHDDGDARQAVGQRLPALVDAHHDLLVEGLRVDDLTAQDLADAGFAVDGEVAILGALGLVDYRHGCADVLRAMTHPERTEVFADTQSYTLVDEEGDRDCFLTEACDAYAFEAVEASQVPLLGTATRRFRQDLRRDAHDEWGALVLGRTDAPEPVEFSTELLAIDQQYGLLALWEQGAGCMRLEAFWVDARFLGLDVPDSFAVDQAVGSMANYAQDIDNWLDGDGE